MPRLRLILMVLVAGCASDAAGPKEPPPPPAQKLTLSELDSKVVSNDWPTTHKRICATVENVSGPIVEWLDGGTVVFTGSCYEVDLPHGIKTLLAKVRGTSLEQSVTFDVVLTRPSITASLVDTTLFQTDFAGAKYAVSGSFSNGDTTAGVWKVGGTVVANGKSTTLLLQGGLRDVCFEHRLDSSLKSCSKATVWKSGTILDVYILNEYSLERPVTGVILCFWSSTHSKECAGVPEAGQVPLKPSFINAVSSYWARLEGPDVFPIEFEVTASKMFSPHGVRLPVRRWFGETINISEPFQCNSSPDFACSLYMTRTDVNGVHYDLGSNPDSIVHILLADASYTDPYQSFPNMGPFESFADQDTAWIWQAFRSIERKPIGRRFVRVSGPGWNVCNSIVLRKRVDNGGYQDSPLGCDANGPKSRNILTGGYTILGKDLFSASFAQKVFYLEHQVVGHEIEGLGHTCSYNSTVMFYAPCNFNLTTLGMRDIAYSRLRREDLRLRLKYPQTQYGLVDAYHTAQGKVPEKFDLKF